MLLSTYVPSFDVTILQVFQNYNIYNTDFDRKEKNLQEFYREKICMHIFSTLYSIDTHFDTSAIDSF